MSTAENRRLLARYVADVWDAADPEAVRLFAGPGYRRHTSGRRALGVDTQVERLVALRTAFPDITLTIDDVVAEGDHMAFRGTLGDPPRSSSASRRPAGPSPSPSWTSSVSRGLIAEHWGGPDLYDLARQLQG